MKKKKTVLSLLFLAALMAATYMVLAKSGKELDFAQMAQFIRAGNPLHFLCAIASLCLFITLEGVSLRCINRSLGHDTGFWPSIIYSASDIYYSAITPSAAGGQPASGYYMVRDGIPISAATSSLVLNIVCYAAALDIIGITALATNFTLFLRMKWTIQLLILAGLIVQLALLIFFLLCMYKSDLVSRMTTAVIRLFARLKLVRNQEATEQKMRKTVNQYAQCVSLITGKPNLLVKVLFLNLAQRFFQILITCFVCTAAPTGTSFLQIMAMQAFCMTGSNCVPLPGSVGAYEYLYIGIFGLDMNAAALVPSMMTARGISYYLCFLFCGIMTWFYHIRTGKR